MEPRSKLSKALSSVPDLALSEMQEETIDHSAVYQFLFLHSRENPIDSVDSEKEAEIVAKLARRHLVGTRKHSTKAQQSVVSDKPDVVRAGIAFPPPPARSRDPAELEAPPFAGA
jgi:hypothetical protein